MALTRAEISRRYRERHPEKIKQKNDSYRLAHPEKIKELGKRYRAEHPDKLLERDRNYRKNNPEKTREKSKRQYQHRKGSGKEKVYRKNYNENVVNGLRDPYLRRVLVDQGFPKEAITEELLEVKRALITLKRLYRELTAHE